MNTEQLLSLVAELTGDEKNFELQEKLGALVNAFNNLASNPQAPSHQTDVAEGLKKLGQALTRLERTYPPATLARMEQIGARPYFTSAMIRRLRQSMDDNPMMPAVVQTDAQQLLDERAAFIAHLNQLEAAMEALGFEETELEEGEAEVGFQIPRTIFENELEGFSRELHELRLIIRAFSEVAGNAGERIELRQISTTDPLLYVALGYVTVKYVGQGVAWCLDRWKTLEEIRNLRANTANLKDVPAAQGMAKQWDEIIKQTVEMSVRQEAERLAAEAKVPAARQHEVANHMAVALEGLLARIERGMTVDIRFIEPPQKEGEEADPEEAAQFEALAAIQKELVFPQIGDSPPLLRLPKQPEKGRGGRRGGSSSGVAPMVT
jgi:hypothetical protein